MSTDQAPAILSSDDVRSSAEHLPLDRLDQAVLDVTAKMKELQATIAEQARRLATMEQQMAELERQGAVTEAKLAVETMHSAGLTAQASHMLTLAIDAEVPALAALLEESPGEGAPKSQLAQIYDEAFDAKAAELGIEDPARFREA